MLIRHLPVCRAASYPYTKIANNNNKSAGKKKIQRETERIPRLVRSIPTGGRRRTEAWYELYQSVVRAVPNCGRSRTKVRYKAYQPLVLTWYAYLFIFHCFSRFPSTGLSNQQRSFGWEEAIALVLSAQMNLMSRYKRYFNNIVTRAVWNVCCCCK